MKLRIMKPAPASNTSVSATLTTTSALAPTARPQPARAGAPASFLEHFVQVGFGSIVVAVGHLAAMPARSHLDANVTSVKNAGNSNPNCDVCHPENEGRPLGRVRTKRWLQQSPDQPRLGRGSLGPLVNPRAFEDVPHDVRQEVDCQRIHTEPHKR